MGCLENQSLKLSLLRKQQGLRRSQFAKKIMSWGGCLIFGSACGALMTGTVVCDAYEHMLSTGACTLPVAPAGPMLPLSYAGSRSPGLHASQHAMLHAMRRGYSTAKKTRVG